jgi:hypothetical protein
MKASSATKITQITQLAANASSRQPLDEVSSSITITGITASVAADPSRPYAKSRPSASTAEVDPPPLTCAREPGDR